MNIFTYGSLTFPEVMSALTERTFRFEDLTLPGWERRKLTGETYPGLIEQASSMVDGRLYFDVDDLSARILDRFEDLIYERRIMQITSQACGTVPALVYLIPAAAREQLSPDIWDREEFRRDHLPAFMEMCREFRLSIAAEILE